MATGTFFGMQYQTSLANYQAFNQLISAAFLAMGWVKTSDTGQGTGAALPAAGAYNGYEMWRMNDSLQATAPCFVKVQYGLAIESVNRLCMLLTVNFGGATDGAGGFVGGTTSTPIRVAPGTQDSTNYYSYYSGSTNRIAFVLNRINSVMHHAWGIERSKANDGTDNSDGIIIQSLNNQDSPKLRVIFLAPGNTVIQGPPTLMSGIYGGWAYNQCFITPIIPYDQFGPRNPGINFLIHQIFDVPCSTYNAKIYGVLRNYYSQTVQNNSNAFWLNSGLVGLEPASGSPYQMTCSMLNE